MVRVVVRFESVSGSTVLSLQPHQLDVLSTYLVRDHIDLTDHDQHASTPGAGRPHALTGCILRPVGPRFPTGDDWGEVERVTPPGVRTKYHVRKFVVVQILYDPRGRNSPRKKILHYILPALLRQRTEEDVGEDVGNKSKNYSNP